jgi:uncharacterized delta-60 repeat protein
MNVSKFGRVAGCGALVLALSLTKVAPAGAGIGDLDAQFAQGGQVLVADNGGSSVLEMPDGRILVIGLPTTNEGTPATGRAIVINRYRASGEPDSSFGQGGRAVANTSLDIMSIGAAALQPDGKVVVAGNYWLKGGLPFVARLDPTGALDPSFGSGGISKPGGGTEPYYSSLVVLSNGEILAAISDWTSDRLDRFAADGRYLGNLSWAIAPAKMALQSDGRLIVSGYHRTLKKSVVMRIDANGQLDPTFGQAGFARIESGYTGNLSVEPDSDRVVLCGPGIVRLTSDGQPDTTFGLRGTGYVAFDSDAVPMFDYCNRLLTPRGGGVVFIGIRQGQAAGGYDRAFVAGLNADGTVDTRFGAGSGASEINLGAIKGSRDWYYDTGNSFIATRGGNALLTWWSDSDPGLKLARVDLGGTDPVVVVPPTAEPAPPPPTAEPAPPPPTAPTPTPTVRSGGGHGGGGAFGWIELAAFGLGLGGLARRRLRFV